MIKMNDRKPKLIAIFATTNNNVIGEQLDDGTHIMPWGRISEDMKHFKNLTEYNVVVMGRNTWDSLGSFAPLPNRTNIIISRTLKQEDIAHHPRTYVYDNVYDAIEQSKKVAKTLNCDVYVMGGAQIYRQTIKYVDTLQVTLLDISPEINKGTVIFDYNDVYRLKRFFIRYSESNVITNEDRKTGEKTDLKFITYIRG